MTLTRETIGQVAIDNGWEQRVSSPRWDSYHRDRAIVVVCAEKSETQNIAYRATWGEPDADYAQTFDQVHAWITESRG